jgi:hypothetical protein
VALAEAEAQLAIPRHSSRGTCYEHSHLDLARSPNHRKADPELRRIGYEHAMSIHAIDLARSPNRGEADPARFGEYAVNIHTSSSCRSPNRLKGQLHVPPPPPLAHANVLVYELIFI